MAAFETLPMDQLKLADVVELFDTGPWNSATVQQIKDGWITFHRPYGASADFSYTGGVICYTGLETCKVPINPKQSFKVWHRKELR